VFPGNGQLSKGFDLACDFIEKHGAALAASHGCRFVLRDIGRDRPEVNEELARRLAQVASLPWVEVRSGTLSAEDFLALFWHADLIVLPYRRRHFYARTSSCVVNAVLSGVPTLVPRDTWLSEQVLKFKAGDVFADGDIDELQAVILRMLDGGHTTTDLVAARAEYDIRRLLPVLTSPATAAA
jgi:glycosyltransferase involved in cell wall biosynthesis